MRVTLKSIATPVDMYVCVNLSIPVPVPIPVSVPVLVPVCVCVCMCAGKHGMMDQLIDVVRKLEKTDTLNLTNCAAAFRINGSAHYAKETYVKMV